MIKNDFGGMPANKITQFIRGKLYIYVDFLLGGGLQVNEDIVD